MHGRWQHKRPDCHKLLPGKQLAIETENRKWAGKCKKNTGTEVFLAHLRTGNSGQLPRAAIGGGLFFVPTAWAVAR
jgi:hypothetical protein